MDFVWVMTYYDVYNDPVVTILNNNQEAIKCYKYFIGEHDKIYEVPIYESFIIKGNDAVAK